jgi:hypothetical protein
MTKASGSHDAIIEPSQGPAYEGPAGRTRTEPVHLVQGDGSVRSQPIYRTVNVRSHPHLKELVLQGRLHRLDDGRELALSFVYHDPDERRFALVVPPALAHTELKAWADLMQEIANEPGYHVPAYVRDSTTVLGLNALAVFLQVPIEPDDTELSEIEARELRERADLIAAREHEVDLQERKLIQLAEDLMAREGELSRQRDALEVRATELSDATGEPDHSHDAQLVADASLAATPPPLDNWIAASPPPAAATPPPLDNWMLADAPPAATPPPLSNWLLPDVSSSGATPPPLGGWVERGVDRDSTMVAEHPPPLPLRGLDVSDAELADMTPHHPPPLRRRSSGGTSPPPLRGHRPGPTPPPLHPRSHTDDAVTVITQTDAFQELARLSAERPAQVSDAEVSELVDVADAGAEVSEVPPSQPPRADEMADPNAVEGLEARPEVEPPTSFWGQRPLEMTYRNENDELWLFVHLDRDHAGAFRRNPELMLQYVEVADYPLVVLCLVDFSGSTPLVARIVLDGLLEQERRVVESLERSFRARVALYEEQHYAETLTVATLREGVARLVGEKLSGARAPTGMSAARALRHVRVAPPPVHNEDLPFGPARRQSASTATVLAAVEQLESWLKPEKLETAQLIYSVPRHVIEATVRRVLRAAIAYGIALPEDLAQAALQHGVATDEASLVRDQLDYFRQRIEKGENDLGEEGTLRNWTELFLRADRVGVAVDPALTRLAESALEPPPAAPRGELAEADASALKHKLRDPIERLGAIRELCLRGHPSAMDEVFQVLPELPATELAVAVAQLLGFGEAVGDRLILALSAPAQELRQAAALGLGRLKLRRALAPLLRQLDQESTDCWTEIARAMGEFGPSALRTVARAVQGARHPERFVQALAHLANHGSAKDVENLENDPDAALADAARRAMARRSRMEWEDLAIREGRTLTDNNAPARFSKVFYAEVAKVDI